MVQDGQSNLLGEDAVDVGIVLILAILGVRAVVVVIGQFQENPGILLVFFLHETAVVHENDQVLGIFLALFLSEQTAVKLIDSFGHANGVAFLLDGGIGGDVGNYFSLLDIGLDGLFLRRLQCRVVVQSLCD